MQYIFTLNMPSAGGHLVHQVIGEHPAPNLAALKSVMETDNFVKVVEYYSHRDGGSGDKTLSREGERLLNTMFIGKVKTLEER